MKILSSVLSGILAASAGVFGKFAFQDSLDLWYYKVASGVIMLLVNSLMLKFLVQSFQELGAAKATVINLTFNYVCSAALGFLVYSEEISLNWIIGACLMFIGVYIIATE
jgi:drug/metabolite transporter (DMT)-like permease